MKLVPYFSVLLLFFLGTQPVLGQEPSRIPIIIDADTANEVDDLFALVRAINTPNFRLLGISSAQFHTSPLASDSTVWESQKINEELVDLMHRKDIPLPLGSNIPLPDMQTPAPSAASQFMIKSAHQMPEGQKLHLVILGPCTNVASALLQDPSILPKIKVSYIGFWHDPKTNAYDKKEFNSRNDPLAVEVLLNSEGLDLDVMTATTCQRLVFDKRQTDRHLKGKGGIADYLVSRWEAYDRWWTKKDPEKRHWIMWDLAIIEALIHPKMAKKSKFATPKENTNRQIGIYTSINVKKMTADFWKNWKPVAK